MRFQRLLGNALTLSILLAIFITLARSSTQDSALVRGDFPGFYVLGKIVYSGQAADLYNLDLQKQIQNNAWPSLAGSVLISVYPPSLAALLTPLGALEPKIALIIFSLLSTCCLLISFYLLRKRSNFLSKAASLHLALLIANPFILAGTIGGQNTAYSIAIISLAIYLFEKSQLYQSKSLSFCSGLALSLWLFKPQFGALILPLILVSNLWIPLLGFLLGALAHYLVGCILLGYSWPLNWISKIKEFSSINYGINSHNQSSLLGSINSLSAEFNYQIPFSEQLTYLLLAILCLTSVWFIKYTRKEPLSQSILIYCGLIPFLAPQTLFYDIGIIVFCSLARLKAPFPIKAEEKLLKLQIILLCFSWSSYLLREEIGIPGFMLVAFAYCYLLFNPRYLEKAPSKLEQ